MQCSVGKEQGGWEDTARKRGPCHTFSLKVCAVCARSARGYQSMADMARLTPETETPVNPYSLLEAVNSSSDTAHTGWLIFLAIMTYLVIAVAGVTHEALLLETPVQLPILQVNIQLKQFFQFAPIVLVLFHLGILAQLVLLARKTLEFDHAIRFLETSDKRTHPLRLELHNFFFVQAIAGPQRSAVMSGFLNIMSWLTIVILPVMLLLYMQVAFLPYHDVTTTWINRICADARHRRRAADRRVPDACRDVVLPGLLALDLRASAELDRDDAGAGARRLPVVLRRHRAGRAARPREPQAAWRGRCRAKAASVQQSGFVAAVPERARPTARCSASSAATSSSPIPISTSDRKRGRREDAAACAAATCATPSSTAPIWRRRSHRRQPRRRQPRRRQSAERLAQLRRARPLSCSATTASPAKCASARNVDLTRAQLGSARLWGVDLRGAKLDEAQLDGADLVQRAAHRRQLLQRASGEGRSHRRRAGAGRQLPQRLAAGRRSDRRAAAARRLLQRRHAGRGAQLRAPAKAPCCAAPISRRRACSRPS